MSMAMPELKTEQKKQLPLVEIVSHCYAAELPQYAAMLVYQASSLVLHKPKHCRVCLSICVQREDQHGTVPSDPNVAKVLSWVKETLKENSIQWTICYQRKVELGRRCIGRNHLALHSNADIVWFADVDQVYRDGVLDQLVEMPWPEQASMVFPRDIMIHRDWITGDERTFAVDLDDLHLVDVELSEFVAKRYKKAIGGVQIVRGDFARKYGYLDRNEKWQQPTEKPLGDFRDDIAYRRFCLDHGLIVGVDLPGLFRLRHTKTSYQDDKK